MPECKKESNNILLVSPDDINSEERVTKVIFRYILDEYINNYLFHIDSQLISQFKLIKEWLLKQTDLVENTGNNKS